MFSFEKNTVDNNKPATLRAAKELWIPLFGDDFPPPPDRDLRFLIKGKTFREMARTLTIVADAINNPKATA